MLKKLTLLKVLGILFTAWMVMGASGCGSIVAYGEIKAERNLDYVQGTDLTENAYKNYKYVGNDYSGISDNEQFVNLTAATVGENQLGIHTLSYDANKVPVVEYLPQGTYSKIPNEFVRVVGAANVPGDSMGVYCNYTEGQEQYLILPPGIQPYPDFMVRFWPTGTRLYRNLGDSAWAAYKAGDAGPTGGADLVETKIDNADLKDTDLPLAYTVDIEFSYNLIQKYAKLFCDMGDPNKAIQSMIGTPMRGQGRTVTGQFGTDVDSPANRAALEQVLKTLLVTVNTGRPVNFLNISLRSVDIGTPEYRAAIQQNATDLESAKSRGLLLVQLQKNADDENTLKETIAAGWSKQMEKVGCTNSWQCLWVVLNATSTSPYFNGQDLQQPPALQQP